MFAIMWTGRYTQVDLLMQTTLGFPGVGGRLMIRAAEIPTETQSVRALNGAANRLRRARRSDFQEKSEMTSVQLGRLEVSITCKSKNEET